MADEYTTLLVRKNASPSPRAKMELESPVVPAETITDSRSSSSWCACDCECDRDQTVRRSFAFCCFLTLSAACGLIVYFTIPEFQRRVPKTTKAEQMPNSTELIFDLDPYAQDDNDNNTNIADELLSYLSESDGTDANENVADGCVFTRRNHELTHFGESERDLLRDLLFESNSWDWRDSTQYTVSKVGQLNRDSTRQVAFISGTRFTRAGGGSAGEKSEQFEDFAIVVKSGSISSDISEIHLISSQYSEETSEEFFKRLFGIFDFDCNGNLSVREYGAMMSAVTGLEQDSTSGFSDNILDFIPVTADSDSTHFDLNEDQFVSLLMYDELCGNVTNFSDLRHIARNGIADGYVAIHSHERMCLYFDLSWNCVMNGTLYGTDKRNALLRVSDTVFASVCCFA